jgi:hypothetical protein
MHQSGISIVVAVNGDMCPSSIQTRHWCTVLYQNDTGVTSGSVRFLCREKAQNKGEMRVDQSKEA